PFDPSQPTTVKFAAYDRVGNVEGVQSKQIQVDTTAPTVPTLAFSGFTNAHLRAGTVYFRTGASGGFTVTPTSSDDESGVASYVYPALGSGWTRSGGDFSFDTSAVDPTEPNNLHAATGPSLVVAH